MGKEKEREGMSGYSVDLRERIIQQWQVGKDQGWLATTFGVSLSSVKRYIARYKKEGHVRATEQERMKPTIRDEQLPELVEQLKAHRDASLEMQVDLWADRYGVRVGVSTMWRAIDRAGWTYKKRRWEPKNGTR
jgi:transposase